MSRHQPIIATAVVLVTIGHAACHRTSRPEELTVAGTVTLVNRVRATVRVEQCSTCASTLETVLRERLSAAEVSVSREHQTVDLAFERSSPFASGSFRQAVKEGGGTIQKVQIEACGTIASAGGRSWITSGSARLLIDGAAPLVTGAEVCVNGELQDLVPPPRLVLGSW